MTQMTTFNGIFTIAHQQSQEFITLRDNVPINSEMVFATNPKDTKLITRNLDEDGRRVDLRTYVLGPNPQWNPQETIIRTSSKLVDPLHVNKAGYRCAKINGASNDDRFFITKDGNAHMPGLIDYGNFWLVDPGGERVAGRIAKADKQACIAAYPYPGSFLDAQGRKYDACGTYIVHDGKVLYYDEVSFYDKKGRLQWDSQNQCFSPVRIQSFYPSHHAPQYQATSPPPEYSVPWDVDLQTMVVAAKSKKQCDYSQDLIMVCKGLQFAFQLPHLLKTEPEKIQKFDKETEGRTVDEFMRQIDRSIVAQKLGKDHYEQKVNVLTNNVSVARQSEIKVYRDNMNMA